MATILSPISMLMSTCEIENDHLTLFVESGCHLISSKQAPEWEIQGKAWKDLVANLCPNIDVLIQRQWLNPCQQIESCGSMPNGTLTYPSCTMTTILSRISVVAEHLRHWIWLLNPFRHWDLMVTWVGKPLMGQKSSTKLAFKKRSRSNLTPMSNIFSIVLSLTRI